MKFYLDSCIWIDYLDFKRENHNKAVELFNKIISRKDLIIVSKVHFREMHATGYFEKFNKIKNKLFEEGVLKGVKYSEQDYQTALRYNEYLNKGFSDCLHLIMAKNNKAKAISSDKHWQEIGQLINLRIFNYQTINSML